MLKTRGGATLLTLFALSAFSQWQVAGAAPSKEATYQLVENWAKGNIYVAEVRGASIKKFAKQ